MWADNDYEEIQQTAIEGTLKLPTTPRQRRRRVAVTNGFSLHADTAVHGNDREGIERLCRYGARGAVAECRLRRLEHGCYEYTPKRGVTFTLTAAKLVKRLVALFATAETTPDFLSRRVCPQFKIAPRRQPAPSTINADCRGSERVTGGKEEAHETPARLQQRCTSERSAMRYWSALAVEGAPSVHSMPRESRRALMSSAFAASRQRSRRKPRRLNSPLPSDGQSVSPRDFDRRASFSCDSRNGRRSPLSQP